MCYNPSFCTFSRRMYELRAPAKPVVSLRLAVLLVLVATPGVRPRRAVSPAAREAEARRGVHREDQGVPAGSADQHRAGRSPAGIRHDSDAAEVLRPDAGHAGRADLREGHPALLRGARQGVGSHLDVDDWQDRRRPRHGAARRRRRGDDQADRQAQGHARVAHRSAEDDRGAGAAADSHGQADLLGDERHALARNRRARDAARAAYRLAVEETPFIQAIRNNVITLITPVIEVDGREKHGRHLLLQQEASCGRAAAAADVLGQVRRARQQPRRHGPVPRADAGTRPRRSSTGSRRSCTTCTRRRRISTRRLAPVPTTSRSIRSRSTSGGCSPRPKSWR